jgi:hypothetical protein
MAAIVLLWFSRRAGSCYGFSENRIFVFHVSLLALGRSTFPRARRCDTPAPSCSRPWFNTSSQLITRAAAWTRRRVPRSSDLKPASSRTCRGCVFICVGQPGSAVNARGVYSCLHHRPPPPLHEPEDDMSSVTMSAVTFTWVTTNWFKKSGVLRSETFTVGGHSW